MSAVPELESLRRRRAPLHMEPAEFRALGHRLVDDLADRLAKLPDGPVVPNESPAAVRNALGAGQPLPSAGTDPGRLLTEATEMLFEHSLFNGHPRFFGYITSSPAPIGMFGDFLAAAVNQNLGAWHLAPMATEVEGQVVRWIAELVGAPSGCGGLLVSGGNMANLVCFAAARVARAPWDVRKEGFPGNSPRLLVYASSEVHTWLQKAVDLCGLGTDAIRWIPVDAQQRMDVAKLRARIVADRQDGHHPIAVVGTAGSVSTGAVDPLPEIAAVCRELDLWFHVDGAYGALAALVPGSPASLAAIGDADSVAVDPHKWLYSPLEAGCALVRDPAALRGAFSYHPAYYRFDETMVNYFDYGPQNSRGFRALKVWLALRHVGRDGYVQAIGDDIRLARHLSRLVADHADFDAVTQSLSITTFRYVPPDLRARLGAEDVERYLNELNQALLAALEKSGEAFMSNAVVAGQYLLRACVVNFHTSLADIESLLPLLSRLGKETDATLRSTRAVHP